MPSRVHEGEGREAHQQHDHPGHDQGPGRRPPGRTTPEGETRARDLQGGLLGRGSPRPACEHRLKELAAITHSNQLVIAHPYGPGYARGRSVFHRVRSRTMPRLTPPLKWHGGKHYLAQQIVALMPPHLHYVEPCFGGGAVLLAHSGEGRSELINDVDGRLMNFWRVLQNPNQFAAFH